MQVQRKCVLLLSARGMKIPEVGHSYLISGLDEHGVPDHTFNTYINLDNGLNYLNQITVQSKQLFFNH